MKRALYETNGDPVEVVRLVDVDTSAPGPGEVRIAVLRSPVNPSDLLQVQGLYGIRPPLPAVPGNEGIARVTALGDGVTGVVEGQVVMVPAGAGVWQQELIVPALGLVQLPDADLDQLGMITVNPPTAYLLLEDFVALQPGDWVIQNAANSSVGGYLVQLAKARGVRTISIVRREGAVAGLKQLGGDVVLVEGPELEAEVKAAVGDGKLRLGLDAVGGTALSRISEMMSNGGVVVSYGAMSGQPATISANATIFKDVSIRGFWLARWFQEAARERKAEVFGAIVGMIAKGELSAQIEAVYALDQISDALAHAAKPGRNGKVLVAPNG